MYYSIGRDGEFDRHELLGEAEKRADDALESGRSDAWDDNEWPDDVDGIEFGALLPIAQASAVDIVESTEGDGGSCDYALLPSRIDAESHITALESENAELRKRLAELEDELRMANHKEDIDRDYTDETFVRFY